MSLSNNFKTLFSARSMIQALSQWKEPGSFFLSTFFPQIKEHATRYVEINFYDEKRRIAPFVQRGGTGQKVDKTSYDKFIWEPPYIKPRLDIEPSELQEALITETPYDAVDPAQRFIELRNEKLFELERMIARREELMAIQAIYDKSIAITDENGTATGDAITFTRESELEFSAATAWSNASTATPIKNVRDAARLINKHTGLSADCVVLGSTAADEFIATSEYINYASKQTFDVAKLEMARDAANFGLTYITHVEGIDYYRYDEWYLNPSNATLTAMIPVDKCLVASKRSLNIRHYGAIETIATASGLVRARRWPKFYDAADLDPEVYGIQLHSAPLPCMHQPNAFAIITT